MTMPCLPIWRVHVRRYLLGLTLAGCAFVAQAATSTTGVAFVHGTGNQTDALNDYWKSAFVNSVRHGLVNPANFVVINCDFSQYRWDSRASGCLAGQLTTLINQRGITALVVNTHSNGSNIMRCILSNPTWEGRHPPTLSKPPRE